MTFTLNGRTYLTDEMTAFRTPDPSVPCVFLTRDRRNVFVLTLGPGGAYRTHRASTPEIISMSRRYGIRDLLNAFPASTGSAELACDEAMAQLAL